MGKGVNKVTLLGNIGRDPEVKTTPSGVIIATLGLATSDRAKDQQGNWQDRTEWHNLVAFNKTAELIRDYAHKGDKLYVEGKIQTRTWEKDGVKQYRTEIIVNDIQLLGPKPEVAESVKQADRINPNILDSDIPF